MLPMNADYNFKKSACVIFDTSFFQPLEFYNIEKLHLPRWPNRKFNSDQKLRR